MGSEALLVAASENLPSGFKLEYDFFSRQKQADGYALLTSPNGAVFNFMLELKKVHRKESLETIKNKLSQNPAEIPRLIICNRLTPALAEYCYTNRLNFIDTAGNAHICLPELYIRIAGKTEVNPVVPESRAAEGVMKLLFVLLSEPEALHKTYRELAAMAAISLGMVSKAFDFLTTNKYYRKAKGVRRIMNTEQLHVLWLRDYATALRPKLTGLRLSASSSWQEVLLAAGECWSGEVAAAELSNNYLIAEKGTLFTPHNLTQRCKELGLKPDRYGNLQLLSTFWGNSFVLNEKARALLCIAELLASRDDRNREAAKVINETYFKFSETALFGD